MQNRNETTVPTDASTEPTSDADYTYNVTPTETIDAITDPSARYETYISSAGLHYFNGNTDSALDYYWRASQIAGIDPALQKTNNTNAYFIAKKASISDYQAKFASLIGGEEQASNQKQDFLVDETL